MLGWLSTPFCTYWSMQVLPHHERSFIKKAIDFHCIILSPTLEILWVEGLSSIFLYYPLILLDFQVKGLILVFLYSLPYFISLLRQGIELSLPMSSSWLRWSSKARGRVGFSYYSFHDHWVFYIRGSCYEDIYFLYSSPFSLTTLGSALRSLSTSPWDQAFLPNKLIKF